MLGLLALAIGTMIRHTAGSISVIIGVLCIWTVLALAAAAYLPERRDA